MKEFSDSIKATLYERATSPLYSTFVFSWLIWNWKIPMVILFGDKQFTRIEYIDNYTDAFGCLAFLPLLFYPLLSALFLLLVLPYFSNWIYTKVLKFKEIRVNNKIKSDNKVLLDPGKALELYQELSTNKAKLANFIEEKNEEVQHLNDENGKLKENIDYLKKRILTLENFESKLSSDNNTHIELIQKLQDKNSNVERFIRAINKDDLFLNSGVYLLSKYSIYEILEIFEEIINKSKSSEPLGVIKSTKEIVRNLEDCKLIDCLPSKFDNDIPSYFLNEMGQKIYDALKKI